MTATEMVTGWSILNTFFFFFFINGKANMQQITSTFSHTTQLNCGNWCGFCFAEYTNGFKKQGEMFMEGEAVESWRIQSCANFLQDVPILWSGRSPHVGLALHCLYSCTLYFSICCWLLPETGFGITFTLTQFRLLGKNSTVISSSILMCK